MKTNAQSSIIKWGIAILLFFGVLAANAQTANPGLIKAALTYKYALNVDWNNEASITKYTFGVLSNDVEIIKGFKSLNGKSIKSKPLSVVAFKSVAELTKVDVLFVDEAFSNSIKSSFTAIKGNNTLLVSDKADDKQSVMINMVEKDGQLKFEVNKNNMFTEGLKVGPKLLLLGGSELDVAALFNETNSNLEKEKETVKNQIKELAAKEAEIAAKRAEIEKQKSEIVKQQQAIAAQQAEIEKQQAEIRKQTAHLNELEGAVKAQQAALAEKTKMLNEQISKIKEQETAIAAQQEEMKQGKEALDKQMKDLAETEAKVSEQKKLMLKQSAALAISKYINYVGGVVLLIIIGLAFFVFRSYQAQKRFNKQLGEKNAEIERFAAKLEIEQELTTNSIRYAKTIQDAILPQHSNMAMHVENFVIFRPKDIVAGDYFWFHQVPAVGHEPERVFVGALDCTGHGVPGAFMSMIGTSILNEIVKEKKIYSPAEILHLLNYGVMNALKQGESDNNDGMDACLVLIERHKGQKPKVIFCGAKRPLFYVTPNNNIIQELKGDRKSIGGAIRKLREVEFNNQELDMEPGTMLYLTTDGFIDQNAPDRVKFGTRKLHKVIHEANKMSIDNQKVAFERALDDHQGKAEQRDDITLIGVKVS